jgi:GNAT superfamily N-acetyltransferase
MGTVQGQIVQLTDGSEVVVRPIGPDDATLLQAFVRRLSARSRRFRFFGALAELSAAQLDRFVNVDPARGFALVAVSGPRESTAIVAEARYALAQEGDNAEFAIAVADDFQRRGLGRQLVNGFSRPPGAEACGVCSARSRQTIARCSASPRTLVSGPGEACRTGAWSSPASSRRTR